jgi:chromosomal replication initiation ATPase DnaA
MKAPITTQKISAYAVPGILRLIIDKIKIEKSVCEELDLKPEQLKQKTRKREIVIARQLSMYFQRKHTKDSLSVIGGQYNKDHCTVLHAYKTVNDLYETDKAFRATVDKISKSIRYPNGITVYNNNLKQTT